MGWFHGVQFDVPRAWEDQSVHRFVVGDDSTQANGAPAQLTIRRERVPADAPVEVVLDVLNRERRHQVGFKVLVQGEAQHQGRVCFWQDSQQAASSAPHPYERHLVFRDDKDHVVHLIMSGARAQVERISQALGLDLVSD